MHRIHCEVSKALIPNEDCPSHSHWCIYGWDPELLPNFPKLNGEFINTEFSALVPIIISTHRRQVLEVLKKPGGVQLLSHFLIIVLIPIIHLKQHGI